MQRGEWTRAAESPAKRFRSFEKRKAGLSCSTSGGKKATHRLCFTARSNRAQLPAILQPGAVASAQVCFPHCARGGSNQALVSAQLAACPVFSPRQQFLVSLPPNRQFPAQQQGPDSVSRVSEVSRSWEVNASNVAVSSFRWRQAQNICSLPIFRKRNQARRSFRL